MTDKSSIKLLPFHYIHVLDRNTNVTRLEIGPQTFIRQDHEKVVTGESPLKMIALPPRNYIAINDPIVIKDSKPQLDKYGQYVVRHGEVEYRFYEQYTQPFPLYPGEKSTGNPVPLAIVKENTALKIEATRNFEKDGKKILAGDEWLFFGPATYYPRVEERIVTQINALVISEGQAIKLRARQDFTDRSKVDRKTGEEWLIRTPGSFLPDLNEIVISTLNGEVLTPESAIQVRALKTFKDFYGIDRKAGEEWLVTYKMASFHIVDIFEELVNVVQITVLRKNEYVYICDPIDPETHKNRLGAKLLKLGEGSFFLQPGESHNGVQTAFILQEDQALLLKALEDFTEDDVQRKPGDRWMVQGPRIYIPSTQVEIVERRQRVALDKNEGVYVRDIQTGLVRVEAGVSYMLKAHEEFWLKELNETEERLVAKNANIPGWVRDKKKVVTFRCPFNHAVQVYDYKKKQSRVVMGPNLVLLGADEEFTVGVLSGGKPKRPGVVQTLSINLGPDFSTDIVTVETSDHTRLNLQLAYNWHFKFDTKDETSIHKIFEVKDFIGNLCNQMASKIRSAVAVVAFEEFHKNSAKIIRKSIFGVDDKGKIKPMCLFEVNNLTVTNVDIQSVEPVDKITLENLQKAVTQALEISTKSLEAQYQYQADMLEQQALGQLEKTKIDFLARAETARKSLLAVQADSQAIQNTGKAKAEARARAEAAEIDSMTRVKIAELKANARKIQVEAELLKRTEMQTVDLNFETEKALLEIEKSKQLSEIESAKFDAIVEAIGRETLVSMANAGPEFQAQLLEGLGLSGYIMTDGNNPINLFNTANGLIGGMTN